MSFKITGMDKLIEKIERLQGPHDVKLVELFDSEFMKKYSNFIDFQEFADKSGFDWNDIASVDESLLDKYVSENTSFSSWSNMKTKAAELWTVKMFNS